MKNLTRAFGLLGLGMGLGMPSCESTDENSLCLETVEQVAVDEAAGPYDLTAALVLQNTAGMYRETLQWQHGGQTDISLDLGKIPLASRFVWSDANPDYTGHDLINCHDRFEIDAWAALRTGDGAIDASGTMTLIADGPSPSLATVKASVVVRQPSGEAIEGQAVATVEPMAEVEFRGQIQVPRVVSRPNDEGERVRSVDIASWPVPAK